MDFWLVLSKNDSNNICSSIKNESFLKIWRVWHILKVCHALWYLKIEMGIAGSIFELHPPNFQKMCIFWRFTNDISTIFCYLLWFQFWKKCQSLPVHPRVVPGLHLLLYYWDFSKDRFICCCAWHGAGIWSDKNHCEIDFTYCWIKAPWIAL